MIETIPGTKAVGQRLANAHINLVETMADVAKITAAEAQHAAAYYIKHKLVKLDAAIGRYTVKHGAYWAPDCIKRAAVIPL